MVEDEYLAELFERAAGDAPSATAALEQVRPRIRRARRRRAVMRGSAGLVVLVVLGGLVSRSTNQPSQHVQVGDSGTTVAVQEPATSAPSTTVTPSGEPQAPAGPATTVRSSTPPASGHGAQSEAAPPTPAAASPTIAAAPAPKPTAPSSGAAAKPPVSSPPNSAAPSSAAASTPQVTSFDAEGGTVQVQYTDTAMNLQSVVPSPGWSVADTKSDGASIEVKFQADDGSATGIDVHLDDGHPTVDTPVDPVDDVANGLTGS